MEAPRGLPRTVEIDYQSHVRPNLLHEVLNMMTYTRSTEVAAHRNKQVLLDMSTGGDVYLPTYLPTYLHTDLEQTCKEKTRRESITQRWGRRTVLIPET